MIGKLTGVLDSAGEDWAVIDVRGVGYVVHCSGRTLARLQGEAGTASLLVETRMREDEITLYGFREAGERAWFRLLTQVQGVGGRVALAILTVLAPDELACAIAAEDRKLLTRADGVGPKLAARIVNELRDRVGAEIFLKPAGTLAGASAAPADGAAAEAVSALVNLGFGRAEAFGAVARAAQAAGEAAPFETLFRSGLKALSG